MGKPSSSEVVAYRVQLNTCSAKIFGSESLSQTHVKCTKNRIYRVSSAAATFNKEAAM